MVYIGGHANHNLSLLPHDLPVHRGFEGCIFDLWMRSGAEMIVPLSASLGVASTAASPRGRNVFQCHEDMCTPNPCANGGSCVAYGASFV
jgi:EYS protein